MKSTSLFILALFSMIFMNCGSVDLPLNNQICGSEIILNTNYDSSVADPFSIINVTREENCLTVQVQYSGGCGDDLVSFDLLGSTISFPYTLPAMLEIKIIMDDNDSCEALITKDLEFDLTPLENEGFNNINMTLEGWNEVIGYSF